MKKLKTISLLILSFACLNNAASGQKSSLENSSANNNSIKVGVDARVELISIVFRLAGNPEYNGGAIRSYERDIERHFAGFKDHPAVEYAEKLRETRLMSCDGPMQLAVHLDRNFRVRKPFNDWPWGLGGRWKKQETQEFIEKVETVVTIQSIFDVFRLLVPIFQHGNINLCWRLSRCLDRANM